VPRLFFHSSLNGRGRSKAHAAGRDNPIDISQFVDAFGFASGDFSNAGRPAAFRFVQMFVRMVKKE
jgi:hypothetical protein